MGTQQVYAVESHRADGAVQPPTQPLCRRPRARAELVAPPQTSAIDTAHPGHQIRGTGTQKPGCVDSATECQVCPGASHRRHLKLVTRLNYKAATGVHGSLVDEHYRLGSDDRHQAWFGEAQAGPTNRRLEAGGVGRIANQVVRKHQ
jgi:hypothetical protein